MPYGCSNSNSGEEQADWYGVPDHRWDCEKPFKLNTSSMFEFQPFPSSLCQMLVIYQMSTGKLFFFFNFLSSVSKVTLFA